MLQTFTDLESSSLRLVLDSQHVTVKGLVSYLSHDCKVETLFDDYFNVEQLFCTFSSPEEKSTTMHSLRHRVLPPQLLLTWPKEASFCLWLLHPEPSSRPKMG